jgi:hypothetical protein
VQGLYYHILSAVKNDAAEKDVKKISRKKNEFIHRAGCMTSSQMSKWAGIQSTIELMHFKNFLFIYTR